MKKTMDIVGLILLCVIIYFVGSIILVTIFELSKLLYYIITTCLIIVSGILIVEPFLKKKS